MLILSNAKNPIKRTETHWEMTPPQSRKACPRPPEGGAKGRGGVMLRTGTYTQSMRALPKHLAAWCSYTPREILRVKYSDCVPPPFLRMTRG